MDKEVYEQPLVSVVMCAYNGLPHIKDAVACIVNQTYSNWELIISDDGSSDGTREWLRDSFKNHPKVRLFFHKVNQGYVANKNFVHKQAKGVYITQLDNDDLCSLDRLEKQLSVLDAYPEIKIVACGFSRIDNRGKVYDECSSKDDLIIKSDYQSEYPFWFPSLLVHRTVFDQIGYFDPYFAGALGDDLYWTKKANKVFPIYCLSDILYQYRDNPNSITNQYTNLRKLIMPEVLSVLIEQLKTGTDWLSINDLEALRSLEASLLRDKSVMAEKYRIWAAKAIDQGKTKHAISLLWKSITLNVFNFKLYRTIWYFVRALFK